MSTGKVSQQRNHGNLFGQLFNFYTPPQPPEHTLNLSYIYVILHIKLLYHRARILVQVTIYLEWKKIVEKISKKCSTFVQCK